MPQLARAVAGGRARSGAPPSPERLRELERVVASGEYRVPVAEVAEAFLRAQSTRRD